MKKESIFICFISLNEEFENPSVWTEETEESINAHANFMEKLGEEGKLIFAGRTDLAPGDKELTGVVLIKAPSIEVARAIMSRDPGLINMIQTSKVFPFKLAINCFHNLA